jgi:hypothetical protein
LSKIRQTPTEDLLELRRVSQAESGSTDHKFAFVPFEYGPPLDHYVDRYEYLVRGIPIVPAAPQT